MESGGLAGTAQIYLMHDLLIVPDILLSITTLSVSCAAGKQ